MGIETLRRYACRHMAVDEPVVLQAAIPRLGLCRSERDFVTLSEERVSAFADLFAVDLHIPGEKDVGCNTSKTHKSTIAREIHYHYRRSLVLPAVPHNLAVEIACATMYASDMQKRVDNASLLTDFHTREDDVVPILWVSIPPNRVH